MTLAYVKDSTRIIDVKRMVQREWQIAPEHQRLIFSCWELSDNQTVGDCKITDECVVQLVEGICRPTTKIFVKMPLRGQTIPIQVDNINRSTTVLDVKRNIQFTLAAVPEEQRLIFAGRELEDSETLEGCNILDESTLHLVLRLSNKIFVKTPTGQRITLDYEGSATIHDIKGRCPDIAPGAGYIIFGGRMIQFPSCRGEGTRELSPAACNMCCTRRSTHTPCSNVWCALPRYSRTTA